MREHAGQGPRRHRGGEWARHERRGRPTTTAEERKAIRAWFVGNLSDGWFVGEPSIEVDDYEILVIGTLPALELSAGDESARDLAAQARLGRFREDTRDRRVTIARDAEAQFGRKVSWGATVNDVTSLFTTASVPMMTRLHMAHRKTLDTLVEANVARSRSEALAWCVELVAQHENEWIATLRTALDAVTQARERARQLVMAQSARHLRGESR